MFKDLSQIEIRKFTEAFEKSSIKADQFIFPSKTEHTQDIFSNNNPVEIYKVVYRPQPEYYILFQRSDLPHSPSNHFFVEYIPGMDQNIISGMQYSWTDAMSNERDDICLTSWLYALLFEKKAKSLNENFFKSFSFNEYTFDDQSDETFTQKEIEELIPNSIKEFQNKIKNEFDIPLDLREQLIKTCDDYIKKLRMDIPKSDWIKSLLYTIAQICARFGEHQIIDKLWHLLVERITVHYNKFLN